MTIRPARIDEIALLQKLNDEVFVGVQEFDDDVIENWAQGENGKNYFTKLLNNPEACCFIAEEAGNDVGYITAAPKEDIYRKSRLLELENMGVIPEYRSKGVGTELIQSLLSWARQKGFKKIYVSAYFGNSKTIDFYKKNGFAEIDLGLEKNI